MLLFICLFSRGAALQTFNENRSSDGLKAIRVGFDDKPTPVRGLQFNSYTSRSGMQGENNDCEHGLVCEEIIKQKDFLYYI